MTTDATTAIAECLNWLTQTQDVVRAAHAATQKGSLSLATVRRDLACRLGRVILDLEPLKAELESLTVAARILDALEREEQARLAAARQNRPRGP